MLEKFKRLVEISAFEARASVIVMRVEESGLEFDCSFKLRRRIRVALFHREPLAGGNMGFR